MTNGEHIGARIRAQRKRRGWSQTELGRRLGVSRVYVSQLERGAVASPGVATLEKLAKALGISVTRLLSSPPPRRRAA